MSGWWRQEHRRSVKKGSTCDKNPVFWINFLYFGFEHGFSTDAGGAAARAAGTTGLVAGATGRALRGEPLQYLQYRARSEQPDRRGAR